MTLDLPKGAAPIVAILRGVHPDEVLSIAAALESAGVRAIEVPLNSPEPFESIARLCREFGERCLCGAGTVLDTNEVDAVYQAGARLIVTPNTDPVVIERAADRALTVIPGFATATEAFQAVEAGASALKLFPAATYGPKHLRALREVLPPHMPVFAVGSVGRANLLEWFDAGAFGVGVGSELYKPGDSPKVVAERARALVAACRSRNERMCDQ
jgi:2-dehydro-3-deoxyphosphogalactonate aldolase